METATAELDTMLAEVRAAPPPFPPRQAIARVRYTHDAMIDVILANPGITQNQLAATFGYTAAWISQILASDAFQAKLASRRAEVVDPVLQEAVDARLKGMMLRSIEVLSEKLNAPADNVPAQVALRTLEVSSRALGYGARDQQMNLQVNVETHLEGLSENLVSLLRKKKSEVIEGTAD